MKRNNVIIIITLIVLLALVSFYFDSEIVKGVFLIRNAFLSDFFIGIAFLSSKAIIFFVLTSLFLWKEHKRKFIIPLWVTLGLSALVSFILKFGIQRLRPYQLGLVPVLAILEKANHFSWNFSFPSSHAMIAFCAVPLLSKEFPRLKYIWIVFAGLVAFSRVYFGLHFLSDVIIGGLIGYLLGMIILRVEKESKFGEKVYRKVFGK